MHGYTLEQRVKVIQTYYESGRSLKNTHRKICDFFGAKNRPSESTIQRLVKKFEETGSVEDRKKSGRPKSGRSAENIAAVTQSIIEEPSTSISRRSLALGIHPSTIWRILNKDKEAPMPTPAYEDDETAKDVAGFQKKKPEKKNLPVRSKLSEKVKKKRLMRVRIVITKKKNKRNKQRKEQTT